MNGQWLSGFWSLGMSQWWNSLVIFLRRAGLLRTSRMQQGYIWKQRFLEEKHSVKKGMCAVRWGMLDPGVKGQGQLADFFNEIPSVFWADKENQKRVSVGLCPGTHSHWPQNKQPEWETGACLHSECCSQAALTLFPGWLDHWPPQCGKDGGFGMNPGSH